MNITQEDRNRWRPPLLEYYKKNRGMDDFEAKEKIKAVFVKAEKGWQKAPKDLDTRIKVLTGFQWDNQTNLNPIKPNIPKAPVGKEEKEGSKSSEHSIYDYLDSEEKKWWDIRFDEYKRDFEFNESSDKPLIVQLLFEELCQRRLFIYQIQNPNKDYSKRLNDSLKRVTELQTKLGITREQRSGALDNIDGNVAEISMHLDKKLELMPKEMKQQYDEELRFLSMKNQKPPINTLPSYDTMKAIISKGADGAKSSEISNKAAQEIHEAVYKEKQEEAKKELPDGERVQ